MGFIHHLFTCKWTLNQVHGDVVLIVCELLSQRILVAKTKVGKHEYGFYTSRVIALMRSFRIPRLRAIVREAY